MKPYITSLLFVISLIIIFWAKALFAPVTIALIIVGLVSTVGKLIQTILSKLKIKTRPFWAKTFAILLGLLVVYVVALISKSNIENLISSLPYYQESFQGLVLQFFNALSTYGISIDQTSISEFTSSGSLAVYAKGIIGSLSSLGSSSVLVLMYVIFLLIELDSLHKKFVAIADAEGSSYPFHQVVHETLSQMRTYVSVRSIGSLVTALLSYIIMLSFGVEFAPFWAMLIFFLNYVPTVGSIVATALPVFWAVVQFQNIPTVLGLGALLIIVQMLVSNGLEPRIAGTKLNLSPFAIFFSLVVGGYVWGALGMIISVPLLIMIRNMLLHGNREARFAATLLSGKLKA